MTKINETINIEQKSKRSHIAVVIWCIIFFLLLFMRDTYSVGINKYVFLAITCMCAVTMKTNQLVYLFCFLFPLYVGLPGNYMTLVLIIRLIFDVHKFKASSLFLSMLLSGTVLLQNIATDHTGIVPMMFIPGIILILMLYTYKNNLDRITMIIMYTAGVAALGFIMLSSTLRVYELSDLMSTSFRLGSSNVDYVAEGIMNVSVDPNFYGLFSIASISLAFPLAFDKKNKLSVRLCLTIFVFMQLIVCLIGLSRAFILVFVAWILMYLLLQKNLKGTLVAAVVIAIIVVLLINFMPDVFVTVLARFEDSDMATGNGRITLIQEHWEEWSSSIITMLFGVGLFNCNVHCMPLQFVFGGGIIMFIMVVLLFLTYRHNNLPKKTLFDNIPFVVTFIMICTVPAATLLNFMFPLVLVDLCSYNTKKVEMRIEDEKN